jgi:hypothetical protein
MLSHGYAMATLRGFGRPDSALGSYLFTHLPTYMGVGGEGQFSLTRSLSLRERVSELPVETEKYRRFPVKGVCSGIANGYLENPTSAGGRPRPG